jgi:hypothetical protein
LGGLVGKATVKEDPYGRQAKNRQRQKQNAGFFASLRMTSNSNSEIQGSFTAFRMTT